MQTSASIFSDAYAGPVLVPSVCKTADFAKDNDRLYESIVENGKCMKGLFVAMGLEAVIVFGIFGIWQALHLIR